jgi:hypothetical protein
MTELLDNDISIIDYRNLNSNASQQDSIIYVAAMHGGTSLYDITHKRLSDFSTCVKKPYFVYSKILCPNDTPLWCQDRSMLWNNLEASNILKIISIAIEIKLSLPLGLTQQHYIDLTIQVATMLVENSFIVDASTHLSKTHDPHAHFLFPLFKPSHDSFSSNSLDFNYATIKQNCLSIISLT